MHGSSGCAVKCVCTGPCRALTPAHHAVAASAFVREGTANGYSRGVLHACPLRARATTGAPAVPQCARTFHGTCTDTRKVTTDSHAPTSAARVRAQRGGTANHTEYPRALGHCRRLLPACSQARAARARARQCDGACGRTQECSRTPTGRRGSGARTQAYGAASRARRAHRAVSCFSSDSAAGIVPSSAFEAKFLRRAWFVPLCTEMRMHRSVIRTHTSTARGGRIGSSSERVLDTGTRGGCSVTVRAGARRGAYGHQRAGALARTRTARHRARGGRTEQ